MVSKVIMCVIPFPIIKLWMHSISSHFCMTTYITQLVTGIQNWFKMASSCMIMLQLTQWALCILWCKGVRSFYIFPVLLTPVHDWSVNHKLKQALLCKWYANKEDFGQQFDVRRHRLEHVFMWMVFTASPITGSSETCITLRTIL